MTALEAIEISTGYGSHIVIPGLSLKIAKGEIVSIIGANGSGKSTMLKALCKLLKPKAGMVYVEGADIHGVPSRQLAKRLSFLPQEHGAPEDVCVRDFVSYGRFPHISPLSRLSGRDIASIDRAIKLAELESLQDRRLSSLSGGER